MVTSNEKAWLAMKTKLEAMRYEPVTIGEPRDTIAAGTVSIIPLEGEVDEATLSHARELHRVGLRMYQNWLDQPQEEIEFKLDQFRADVLADVFGDFTLGGEIAYVELDKAKAEWEWDNLEVASVRFRVIEVVFGYRIDDRTETTP